TQLSGLAPSSVYDLNTAVIARAPDSMQKAWGETYTYTVSARTDYSQDVSFWDMTQRYYIHKVGADWFILGEGRDAPPLTWSPRKAAAVEEQPPAAATDSDTRKSIAESFEACMGALLSKDADTGLARMSENIHF